MTSTFLRCALALGMAAAPLAAKAQHVVTEAEASKLTLEALTAAPRPIYRTYYRPISTVRYEHARARGYGWQRAVIRTSYRVGVAHRAAHHRR